jgi:hypothetical protein
MENNDTIVRNGKRYVYDADFDVYRPHYTGAITQWDRWGWIIVLAILLAISVYTAL